MYKSVYSTFDEKYTLSEIELRNNFYDSSNVHELTSNTIEFVPSFTTDGYHDNALKSVMDNVFNKAISGMKITKTIPDMNTDVINLFQKRVQTDTLNNKTYVEKVNKPIPKPMKREDFLPERENSEYLDF
jgi:ketol-acid reductoisomerase